MKKNKTVTNILLIIVPALWLFFFYRVYTSFFAEKPKPEVTFESSVKKKIQLDDSEEFAIQANYPDPFASKMSPVNYRTTIAEEVSIRKVKVTKPKKEVVKVDWSFIRYIGLIKSPNYKKQVALIAINEKEYMVSEGDKPESVSIIKLEKDSIKVSYQNVVTFIKK